MRSIAYEPAEQQDVERIYALSKKLIDDYEDIQSIEYEKVLAWVRKKIEKNIGSYTRILCGGCLAGYYRLIDEGDTAELDDFYVLEEFRGNGIGTEVLRHILSQCEREIMLYVFNRNTGAIRLYERMGFKTVQMVGRTRRIMARKKKI